MDRSLALLFELEDVAGVKAYKRGPKTLIDLFQSGDRFRDRVQLAIGDRQATFGETATMAAGLADLLKQQYGLVCGDAVIIAETAGFDFFISLMAVSLTGATPVLVENRAQVVSEALARITGCRLVLGAPEALPPDALPPDAAPVTVACAGDLIASLGHSRTVLEFPRPAVDPETTALITFTSGSTAAPKGVVLTHRNVTAGLQNMMLTAMLSAKSRPAQAGRPGAFAPSALLLPPFSHISRFSQFLLSFSIGGRLAFPANAGAGAIVEAVSRNQVRSIWGLPHEQMAVLLAQSQTALASLAYVQLHGISVAPALRRRIENALPGVQVGSGYGLTETMGTICAPDGEATDGAARLIGLPLPVVQVRIERHIRIASPGYGEILVKGANIMKAYMGDAKATDRAFAGDWFRTGDIGRLDAGARLWLIDRVQNVFELAGQPMSLTEIEARALNHADVDDAGAFFCGTSTAIRVTIACRTRPGRDLDALRREIIEAISLPDLALEVAIVPDIPRTASGKIDRRCLADRRPVESL